jgi:thiosulfate reductase cytochrome b subunit
MKIYLITLPERIWHWLNALFFILLAVTGILMHYSENLESISLASLVKVHNVTSFLFLLNFLFWFIYEAATGRIKYYIRFTKALPVELFNQARYYLFGIFNKGHSPYPTSEERKFNPLQQVSYFFLMLFILPVQIVSGVVLYGITKNIEWITNLTAFKSIAVIHTLFSFLAVTFLIVHLYLSTTGKKLTSLLESMITGYHTVESKTVKKRSPKK